MHVSFKPNNEKIYKAYLEMLLSECERLNKSILDKNSEFKCEICGISHNFDFNVKYAEVIKENNPKYNPKDKSKFYSAGRDFFPLVGSMGSEAQGFSNMSRPVNICPRCLLLVQYLPLSSFLVEGKLGFIQASDLSVQYELTKISVQSILDKIQSSGANAQIPNLGQKEKNKSIIVIRKMFEYFRNLIVKIPQQERYSKLSKITDFSCTLWKLSNSGQGAYLESELWPNEVIKFLFLCNVLGIEEELIQVLENEHKMIKYPPKQFINCLRNKKTYYFENLITKKFIPSENLLFLYEYYILGKSQLDMKLYCQLSEQILLLEPDKEKD